MARGTVAALVAVSLAPRSRRVIVVELNDGEDIGVFLATDADIASGRALSPERGMADARLASRMSGARLFDHSDRVRTDADS